MVAGSGSCGAKLLSLLLRLLQLLAIVQKLANSLLKLLSLLLTCRGTHAWPCVAAIAEATSCGTKVSCATSESDSSAQLDLEAAVSKACRHGAGAGTGGAGGPGATQAGSEPTTSREVCAGEGGTGGPTTSREVCVGVARWPPDLWPTEGGGFGLWVLLCDSKEAEMDLTECRMLTRFVVAAIATATSRGI